MACASGAKNNVLRYKGTTGAFLGVFASGAGLDRPGGVVFGADGNLYVGNVEPDNVLRYNGTTGAFLGVFASGGGLNNPLGLVFGPDGNLYVASSSATNVLRYNGTTGAFLDAFASGGGLDQPAFLIFSSQASPVPHAATLTLLAVGLTMCLLAARRRT